MIKSQGSLIGLILLTLTACSSSQPPANTGKYKPVVNPHPQYFVTVSGHIDPELAKAVHLSWQTTAWTKNKKCNVTYNKLEGVVGWRNQVTHYPVKIDAHGNYSIKIPIDHYLPGYCAWQMRTISFNLQDIWPGEALVASFSKKHEKLRNRFAKTNIGCHWDKKHQLDCETIGDFGAYGNQSTYDVNPYQNYQYQVNIHQKEIRHAQSH